MDESETSLSWWDREVDPAGRPIRADVRLAAHEIWPEACRRTQAVLADHAHAADLMECCVPQVSRYLDLRAVPLPSRKMNGLLMLAFSRALRRRASRLNRVQSVGGSDELFSRAVDRTWSRQIDAHLELEEIVRLLSERSRTILVLRYAGYTWKEAARLLEETVPSLRSAFWRDITRVKGALANQRSAKPECHAKAPSQSAPIDAQH